MQQMRRKVCERKENGLVNKHMFSTINVDFVKLGRGQFGWGEYTRLYTRLNYAPEHIFAFSFQNFAFCMNF